MTKSLHFRIKNTVAEDKHRLLELFFKDWVDSSCDNQVNYKIERGVVENTHSGLCYNETLRVDFERVEDATVLSLKGVPPEFSDYIEFVHNTVP